MTQEKTQRLADLAEQLSEALMTAAIFRAAPSRPSGRAKIGGPAQGSIINDA